MKHITIEQSRIIARELVQFINKHVPAWDMDEKPTIKDAMNDIRNDPDGVLRWMREYVTFNLGNEELNKDAFKIFKMMREARA